MQVEHTRTILIDKPFKGIRASDIIYALYTCSNSTLKIYLYFYLQEPNEKFKISYQELSEIIGLSKNTIVRGWAKMVEEGFIEPLEKLGDYVFHIRARPKT